MRLLQKKNQEYRELEAKHQELKQLLTSLQGCMGQEQEPIDQELTNLEPTNLEPTNQEPTNLEHPNILSVGASTGMTVDSLGSKGSQPNLFDSPAEKVAFKHTLFE